MSLTNAQISELLARRADEIEDDQRARAYRSAARAAYTWPEEAADLIEADRPLTDFRRVGTKLAHVIKKWLDDPPEVPEPPEERSGFLTMTDVRRILDEHPDRRDELRGDLQMHTISSDGRDTVGEMAEAGVQLGHDYIAITDHSKGLRIAGGMDEEGFAAQALEVARTNQELEAAGLPLRVLHGIEMNLSPDGTGEMEPDSLSRLDLVLGSFHSRLRLTEDQTDRYLAALRNPHIHVLGHPRGRIFNRRAGLRAEWERVFAAAADAGIAVEIDCYPDRQDLSVDLIELAETAGVMFSIGTDAHNRAEMSFVDFGVAAAAAAGVPRDRILNHWPREQLLAWTHARRRR